MVTLEDLAAELHKATGDRLALGWAISTLMFDQANAILGRHPFLYLVGDNAHDAARLIMWLTACGMAPTLNARDKTWRKLVKQKTRAPLWVHGHFERQTQAYNRPVMVTGETEPPPGELRVDFKINAPGSWDRVVLMQDTAADAFISVDPKKELELRDAAKHADKLGYKLNASSVALAMAGARYVSHAAYETLFTEGPGPLPMTAAQYFWLGIEEMYHYGDLRAGWARASTNYVYIELKTLIDAFCKKSEFTYSETKTFRTRVTSSINDAPYLVRHSGPDKIVLFKSLAPAFLAKVAIPA